MIEQGSVEWFAQRLGKVTASRISDVMAKTKTGYSASRKNYMMQLLCERLTGKKVKLTSERINVSPMRYYGGKLYTVAELKREFPNERILISNIEGNGYDKAIRCRTGNWQPFEETDVFVEAAA